MGLGRFVVDREYNTQARAGLVDFIRADKRALWDRWMDSPIEDKAQDALNAIWLGAPLAKGGSMARGALELSDVAGAGRSYGQGWDWGLPEARAPLALDDVPPSNRIDFVANKMPLGFGQASEFESFGNSLYQELDSAGYRSVDAAFQGSSVTGRAFRPPHDPFDVGRVSDYDIALSSPELLQCAQDVGVGLRQGGLRTGPLRPEYLERLGLTDLSTQLSQQAGRPVNFMIYRSIDDAVARSPSILVPRKP